MYPFAGLFSKTLLMLLNPVKCNPSPDLRSNSEKVAKNRSINGSGKTKCHFLTTNNKKCHNQTKGKEIWSPSPNGSHSFIPI